MSATELLDSTLRDYAGKAEPHTPTAPNGDVDDLDPGPLILVDDLDDRDTVRRWQFEAEHLNVASSSGVTGRTVIVLAQDNAEHQKCADTAAQQARANKATSADVRALPGWGPGRKKLGRWCERHNLRDAIAGKLVIANPAPGNTIAGGKSQPPDRGQSKAKQRGQTRDMSDPFGDNTGCGSIKVDTTESKPEPAEFSPYTTREKDRRICRNGIPICNFGATITDEVVYDDGAEQTRRLRIEGILASGEKLPTIEVPVNEFAGGDWPLKHWGIRAIVNPGSSAKDHLRAAIQELSLKANSRVVYGHTGWRRIGERWVYLHGGGAIGPIGPIGPAGAIDVELPDALQRYEFPVPPSGAERTAAVKAALELVLLATDYVMFPLLAATYRAVMPDATSSLHVVGRTGAGKTELAAICQQHFGSGMDAKNLPASWSSTGNSLEAVAFAAKDALLVVDDFCPTGAQSDIARTHRESDRLLRAQGNRLGRQRMRADGTVRPVKPPRGTILSTGEDIPDGHSLRARMLIIEVGPDDLDFGRLSECQRLAATGVYSQAMAAFIAWISPCFDDVIKGFRSAAAQVRDDIGAAGQHRRTPTIVAELLAGFGLFIQFAVEIGAVTADEGEALLARCQAALLASASVQSSHQGDSDAVYKFFRLLQGIISSGRAHVASLQGGSPDELPQAWGWRPLGSPEDEAWQERRYEPQGRCVGWIDGEDVYLDPESTFAEVNKLAAEQGRPLSVTASVLHKRMVEQRLLVTAERGHHTVRRLIGGARRRVLHLRSETVLSVPESGPTGPTGPMAKNHGQNGPVSGTDYSEHTEKRSTESVHLPPENQAAGPNGPIGPPLRTDEATSSRPLSHEATHTRRGREVF
jgi:Domain of unknown function (DUF927)